MAVRRERRGPVEILAIDRPETRNAIDPQTTADFERAFDELEADDGVRVVVLTATGDISFCSGVDLKVQAQDGIAGLATDRGGFAGIVKRWFPKPLIAAVNGHALGGGLELVLACDFAIAADHAELGSTEVKLGQLADAGTLIRLQNRIPFGLATELVLRGHRISAHRAAEVGLVSHVVPGNELIDATLRIANEVARNSPAAVALSKDLLREAHGLPEKEAWALNEKYARKIRATQDYVEGALAFVEKREPQWT